MKICLKLLTSELISASSYIERLFHALLNISSFKGHASIKETCFNLQSEINELLRDELFKKRFSPSDQDDKDVANIRESVKISTNLLKFFLQLDLNHQESIDLTVKLINIIYKHSFQLHIFCQKNTNLEVQYPRPNLAEIINQKNDDTGNHDKEAIVEFNLQIENVLRFGQSDGQIDSLEWQREKKYDLLVQEGNKAIFNKKYEDALKKFSKARNYKETAEILTMIAHVWFLQGRNEKAKTYCLKAIRNNPDYGPPYNDLGNYILAEGQINESLKWFELAKKTIIYEHREYPYINAGRVYMAKKDYQKALDEFSKALTLAPYHEELHKTVQRLRLSLDKDFDSIETIRQREHLKPVIDRGIHPLS